MKIALVRGAFLNQYEAQIFFPIVKKHDLVGFSSLHPIHDQFLFPVVKCPSPMDLNFGSFSRIKMPLLNRLFIDAHLLWGLEDKLEGFDIAHCADTFYHFTHQCVVAKKQGKVKKVVATIFENIPFNNEGIRGRREAKQYILKNLDCAIAISKASKEALTLEGYPVIEGYDFEKKFDFNNFLESFSRTGFQATHLAQGIEIIKEEKEIIEKEVLEEEIQGLGILLGA